MNSFSGPEVKTKLVKKGMWGEIKAAAIAEVLLDQILHSKMTWTANLSAAEWQKAQHLTANTSSYEKSW